MATYSWAEILKLLEVWGLDLERVNVLFGIPNRSSRELLLI